MKQEDINKAFYNRWRIKRDANSNVFEGVGNYCETIIRAICRDFFEAGILLGEGTEEKKPSKAVQLTIRQNCFFNSLNTPENLEKYGTQMLRDFFDYWTEPNRSGTKMRFELQQTFDINRRLARWARNNFNRYDRQPTKQDPRERIADILVG